MSDDRSIERFIEAIATGKAARTRLSPGGLGRISDQWPEAMRAVVNLGTAHPLAQQRMLDTWARTGWIIQRWIGDDDLFFAAMRVLLPRYDGPAMELYRGQAEGQPIGTSWTRSWHVALKFALYGMQNVEALWLHPAHQRAIPKRYRPRDGAIILRATVTPDRIISAPCLHGQLEGEYIVDPRGMPMAVVELCAHAGRNAEVQRGASLDCWGNQAGS